MCEHLVFLSYLLTGSAYSEKKGGKANFQKHLTDTVRHPGDKRINSVLCNPGGNLMSQNYLLYSFERIFLENHNTLLAVSPVLCS